MGCFPEFPLSTDVRPTAWRNFCLKLYRRKDEKTACTKAMPRHDPCTCDTQRGATIASPPRRRCLCKNDASRANVQVREESQRSQVGRKRVRATDAARRVHLVRDKDSWLSHRLWPRRRAGDGFVERDPHALVHRSSDGHSTPCASVVTYLVHF